MRENSFVIIVSYGHDRTPDNLPDREFNAGERLHKAFSPFEIIYLNKIQLTTTLSCDIVKWTKFTKRKQEAAETENERKIKF